MAEEIVGKITVGLTKRECDDMRETIRTHLASLPVHVSMRRTATLLARALDALDQLCSDDKKKESSDDYP